MKWSRTLREMLSFCMETISWYSGFGQTEKGKKFKKVKNLVLLITVGQKAGIRNVRGKGQTSLIVPECASWDVSEVLKKNLKGTVWGVSGHGYRIQV